MNPSFMSPYTTGFSTFTSIGSNSEKYFVSMFSHFKVIHG